MRSWHPYIEQLGTMASKPIAKQHLAAIRQLFDYVTPGGVLDVNPGRKRENCPIQIESNTLIRLRDRDDGLQLRPRRCRHRYEGRRLLPAPKALVAPLA